MTHRPENRDNNADQAQFWVQRLASGESDAHDIEALKKWLAQSPAHASAFERERAFWQDMGAHRHLFQSGMPTQADKTDQPLLEDTARAPHHHGRWHWPLRSSRNGTSRKTSPQKTGPTGKKRIMKGAAMKGLAIAAALLVTVLAGPEIIVHLRADHITATGTIKTVTLADGSRMVLDSQSAIAIAYDGTERRLELLRGRAWFDVAHGDSRPFRIVAADGMTEDIGTAFEVAHEADGSARTGVSVSVSEGMARMTPSPQGQPLTLKAGERAGYFGGEAHMYAPVAPDRIAGWRHGEVLIHNEPLSAALTEIGRYHKGKIWLASPSSGTKIVSGIFRTDESEDAVAALASSAGLRVTHLPAGIILLR